MPEPTLDIDAVTRLIIQVARDIVTPKFRALRGDEIERKPTVGNVEDIVTVVDRNVEARLAGGLRDLLPSSRVIGEEAAHADPALLALVDADEPVWIVDPLDGTSNFASGSDGFGIMVSLAARGHTRAAWVHLPVRDEFFVAEAGSGTYLNGQRLRVPPADETRVPRGTFFVRYMPDSLRESVSACAAGRFVHVPHAGAAAVEYTEVLRGRKEFAVYYRLLPWDHGAPALVLTEGGGSVEHLNGTPYTVRSPNQLTLVTRDAGTASRLRAWLGP
jgi:fructose-1,6-bisphosphatase/inositol monophosphatase family enzyme